MNTQSTFTRTRVRQRSAFASVTAVILMGLLGAAITALLVMVSADYQRTQRQLRTAQMRQMLVAGTAQVLEQAHNWPQQPPASITIALPDSLRDSEASLQMRPVAGPDNSIDVQMSAQFGKQRSRQLLHLVKKEGAWSLGGVELIQ